jgi:hypothetical protein
MRNAKLRKTVTIPELTQENIDSAEDVSGTVNPSVVSFGGDEVLKDWTITSSLETNLFSGLDPSSFDYNDIQIEFKNCQGEGGGFGGKDSHINLQFKTVGAVDAWASGSTEVCASSSGGNITVSPDLFVLFRTNTDFKNGKATVKLFENNEIGNSGWVSESIAPSTTFLQSSFLSVISEFTTNQEGNIPSELWLHGVSSNAVNFSAEYRIVRK